jgi:hypothetical protein
MKLAQIHSHRFGLDAVKAVGLYDEIVSAVEGPRVVVTAKSGAQAKEAVLSRLQKAGWAPDALVAAGFGLDVNAMKSEICLTTQTGNISRAFYDLLKFEALHKAGRAEAAVLVVPTKGAARVIGSNIASFERIRDELQLFRHVVTVPLLLLGFE